MLSRVYNFSRAPEIEFHRNTKNKCLNAPLRRVEKRTSYEKTEDEKNY